MFTNGQEDQGSIPGQVIPKTQKRVLDTFLLNTQHYKVCIKGKWSNPRKGVVSSPIPWCSSYWKGNLRVTLDFNQPTYIRGSSWGGMVKVLNCDLKVSEFELQLKKVVHFCTNTLEKGMKSPIPPLMDNSYFSRMSLPLDNPHKPLNQESKLSIYIYIYIYSAFNKFPDFMCTGI